MATGPVVALAGGVGAARYLRGVARAVPHDALTIVGNTGDDREFYGVHVSPDLDIVTYTLAERIDPERGYGLAGDTHRIVDTLARYGHETWFRLGDEDLASCLHRTLRLAAGTGLAEITQEIAHAQGLSLRILPMSEDPCPTRIALRDGRRIHFEEYLARDGAPDEVAEVDLSAAAAATPAPGVVEAIEGASVILVCPSNPLVSIGPILAVPGIADAIRRSTAPKIAVSPIIGGAPVKGPADKLMRGIGLEVSALGVARLYADWCDGFVIDERDAELAPAVEATGLSCAVTRTLMKDAAIAEALARTALALAEGAA